LIPASSELVYYVDEKCEKPFPFEEGKQRIISEDAVRQGDNGKMTVYLRNESKNVFVINAIKTGDMTKIHASNHTIKSGEAIKIDLEWTIPEDLEDPFQTGFRVEGDFIIRP